MYLHRNEPAMEMIDFGVYGSLGADLEAITTEIIDQPGDVSFESNVDKLADVIFNHTGIKLVCVIVDKTQCTPFSIGAEYLVIKSNDILMRQLVGEGTALHTPMDKLKHIQEYRGDVDVTKGKVGGVFSKIVNRLIIPRHVDLSGWTPKELAAVILHEVGHIFCMYELIIRTLTTNFVLEEARNRLLGIGSGKNSIVLVDDIEKAAGYEKDTLSTINTTQNDNELYIIAQSASVNAARNDLGINIYSARSTEQLADQYVSRCGYGKYLISALAKVQHFSDQITRGGVIGNTITALSHAIAIHGKKDGLLRTILPFLVENNTGDRYDTPKRRLEVIRNDMIKELKNAGSDKTRVKEIIDALLESEQIIAKSPEIKTIMTWFGETFSTANTRAINIQKKLEDLSSSRLNASLKMLELALG